MTLFSTRQGKGDLTLILLAYLGGSHREWADVVSALHDEVPTLAVDLPGFGESADNPGYTVAEMAKSLLETLAAQPGLERFVVVGHSMGGKVAAAIARAAADGDERAKGLAGLVLVAPSPPSPEPMTDRKRAQMLESLGGAPADPGDERGQQRDRDAAEKYVRDNSAEDLSNNSFASATADALRMNRAAWRAWLEAGSREDWSARVGVLPLPVLLVAGDRDASLGPDVQKTVSLPHWPGARLSSLHSNHLIPMEKPAELARLLAEFVRGLKGEGVRADLPSTTPAEVPLDQRYIDLILSERVSEATRNVLSARAEPDDPAYTPRVLSVTQLAQVRAAAARIVPQRGSITIDLASRLHQQLADSPGDGWRYADLPTDPDACRAGLDTLEWHAQAEHGKGWLALTGAEQDDLLSRAQAGKLGLGFAHTVIDRLEALVGVNPHADPALSSEQMQRWFEDLRANLTRLYVAHPATLDRMGYSGIADGADSAHQTGFTLIGIGEVESWEPSARGSVAVRATSHVPAEAVPEGAR